METVTVAQLKAKLSQYLRRVEAGETIIVSRHGTPVARLVRAERPRLQIRPPRRPSERWGETDLPPLKLKRDVLEYLWEERADRDLLGGCEPLLSDYSDEDRE